MFLSLSAKDVGVLILASNNLRSLPLEVRRMKSLIKLDISRNGIRCTHPGVSEKIFFSPPQAQTFVLSTMLLLQRFNPLPVL